MSEYPLIGFHFIVKFDNFKNQNDIAFQQISGLTITVDVDSDTYKEGGQNRFVHRLPGRTKYEDLILKRGKMLKSQITDWVINSVKNLDFQPTNLMISILDENSSDIFSWYVVNAIPIKYDISGIDAEQNQIVIESLTFRYEYFEIQKKSAPDNPETSNGDNGQVKPSTSTTYP